VRGRGSNIPGLSGQIYLEKGSYVRGEPILLGLRISNRGPHDLLLVPPALNMGTVALMLFGGIYTSDTRYWRDNGSGFRIGPERVVRLRAGETRVWKMPLRILASNIRPARYRIKAQYNRGWSAFWGELGSQAWSPGFGPREHQRTRVEWSEVPDCQIDMGSVAFSVIDGNKLENEVAEFRPGVLVAGSPAWYQKLYPACSYVRDYYRYFIATDASLEDLLRFQPESQLADDAILILARRCHAAGQTEQARQWLQRLVRQYPHGDRKKEAAFLLEHGFGS